MNGDERSFAIGRKFMTDLLVNSLMAEGVLESALCAAIKVEIQEMDELKVGFQSSFFFLFT